MRRITSENGFSSEIKCSICGSTDVSAKIEGKYYCYRCGSRILHKHVLKLLEELKEKGLVMDNI